MKPPIKIYYFKYLILLFLISGCDEHRNSIAKYGYGDSVCVATTEEYHNCSQPMIISNVYTEGTKETLYKANTLCKSVQLQFIFRESEIIPCSKIPCYGNKQC